MNCFHVNWYVIHEDHKTVILMFTQMEIEISKQAFKANDLLPGSAIIHSSWYFKEITSFLIDYI